MINNVRFFDGERMHEPSAIWISDGRISEIGPTLADRTATNTIDGAGKTLLPGLIDAHVHTFASAQRDAVTFGVTTLIDMFTSPAELVGAREARDRFAATTEAALFSAGMLATVEGGHGTQYGIEMEVLSGPADAPGWVARRKAAGSDFIKLVYMPYARSIRSLDRETAAAVIAAAHDVGLLAVAHVSSLEGAREMLQAGVDGFVHVFADALADDAFVQSAVQHGVFVIPTLAVIAMADGQSTGPALIDDPHLGPLLTPTAKNNLRQDFGRPAPAFQLDLALQNVQRLHTAGVPILVGSDAPNPGTHHGVSVHAELALLVRAGLTEIEALAAATSLPARIFGTSSRGRIEAGARADLVLVDGQPDSNILDTRKIDRVLRNGVPVGKLVVYGSEDAGDSLSLSGLLGDFDEGLAAPEGLIWSETTDARMGGASTATRAFVERGQGQALEITAEIVRGFPYPWAGVYLGPAREGLVGNLGDARAIAFDIRGTPATYRLMVFASGMIGPPPTAEFAVSEDWQRVEIPIDSIAGVQRDQFSGMTIVTPIIVGEYRFAVDNVELMP
ncbi:MAG: amidohydrolase family protein [Pseudomonadota bacterium]